MKTTSWILLAVLGAALIIAGLAIMPIIVWVNQTYGTPPYTFNMLMPSTPFFMPGMALATVGGLLITFSILGFIIAYSKKAAVEVIAEGARARGTGTIAAGATQVPAKEGTSQTKYCSNCGATMALDATYCSKCGQKQP